MLTCTHCGKQTDVADQLLSERVYWIERGESYLVTLEDDGWDCDHCGENNPNPIAEVAAKEVQRELF